MISKTEYTPMYEKFKQGDKYDAEIYYNLGLRCLLSHDYTLARDNFQKSLEITPYFLEAYKGIAQCLLAENKEVECREYYHRITFFEMPEIDWQNYFARLLSRNSVYMNRQFLNIEETIFNIHGDTPWGVYQLGMTHYALKDLGNSLIYFEKACSLDAESILFLHKVAIIHRELKQVSLAEKYHSLILQSEHPDRHWLVSLERSLLSKYSGHHQESIKELENAVESHPGVAKLHCYLGHALYEMEQYIRAIDALKKSIEIDPYYSEPYFQLAAVFLQLKEYDEALLILENLERFSQHSQRWRICYNKSLCFSYLGNKRSFEDELMQSAFWAFTSENNLEMIADLFKQNSDNINVLDIYSRILHLNQDYHFAEADLSK